MGRPTGDGWVGSSLSLPVGSGIPPRQLVRLIEVADAAGLAGVAVGELASTDPFALIAAAAPRTSRIRLETSVVSVVSRSPSLLAMSAATLADLSGNRFVLGVGAGSPIVAGFHGVEFVDVLHRVERWLVDVRAALEGRSLEGWGSFRLRGLDAVPVPLLLAAMNPRMLELAGRLADGVILNFCGPVQVEDLVRSALEARAVEDADRPFEVHTTLWADGRGNVEQARARFSSEMAPYLAVPTYRSAVVALSDEDAVDRVGAAWRANGRQAAAALFPASIIDAMLAASGEDLVAKIAALRAAGCTGVRVTPLTHQPGDPVDAERVIDMVAEADEVIANAG